MTGATVERPTHEMRPDVPLEVMPLTTLISRRVFMSRSTVAWLMLTAPPMAALAAVDEPARLVDAVSFDLGGTAGQPPWRITLYVPPGPAPAAGWPILYLLDGNAVTGTAIDIERVQAPYPDGTGIGSRFAMSGSAIQAIRPMTVCAGPGTTPRHLANPTRPTGPMALRSGRGAPTLSCASSSTS